MKQIVFCISIFLFQSRLVADRLGCVYISKEELGTPSNDQVSESLLNKLQCCILVTLITDLFSLLFLFHFICINFLYQEIVSLIKGRVSKRDCIEKVSQSYFLFFLPRRHELIFVSQISKVFQFLEICMNFNYFVISENLLWESSFPSLAKKVAYGFYNNVYDWFEVV